jgi:hypothetical protein
MEWNVDMRLNTLRNQFGCLQQIAFTREGMWLKCHRMWTDTLKIPLRQQKLGSPVPCGACPLRYVYLCADALQPAYKQGGQQGVGKHGTRNVNRLSSAVGQRPHLLRAGKDIVGRGVRETAVPRKRR